jgi:hypothetical protein
MVVVVVNMMPVFCFHHAPVSVPSRAFTVVSSGILPNHSVSEASRGLSYLIAMRLSQRGTCREQGQSKSSEDPVHEVLFLAQILSE